MAVLASGHGDFDLRRQEAPGRPRREGRGVRCAEAHGGKLDSDREPFRPDREAPLVVELVRNRMSARKHATVASTSSNPK